MAAQLYLIPTVLLEGMVEPIPAYLLDAIKSCNVFFVENERTTRRYFKMLWKEMAIDEYEWFTIHKAEEAVKQSFVAQLKAGKKIGIVSEAGCPGIADPGQILVHVAQQMQVIVKPLVGPNSIILALMASGMNGQHFSFVGYLPVDNADRKKMIRELENESARKRSTQIFIETPYRNNQILEEIIKTCLPQTQLCVAVDITGKTEMIVTKTIADWKKTPINLHKRPAIFLLQAG